MGLDAGARNLLRNCAGLRRGWKVVVVAEDPGLGWYDDAAPEAVADTARKMGAHVSVIPVGGPEAGLPDPVRAQIAASDLSVFFARIGDQDRFGDRLQGARTVMSYARTAPALASLHGRLDHRAMLALKAAVDTVLAAARLIEITCPLGTCLSARRDQMVTTPGRDVSILRFPLGVPRPVEAAAFSGSVTLARYLTPTGSRSYTPASLALPGADAAEPVSAEVLGGRIRGFAGPEAMVAQIEAHYTHVSGLYGIDPWVVHSWHAGIHPGCGFDAPAGRDPDLWSNSVFNNPRFLHFHTCGAYAPGEICWMIADPTVRVDGRDLWRDGRLNLSGFPSLAGALADWPVLARAFRAPVLSVGIEPV